MSRPLTRAELEALDRVDPLARHRANFDLPEGVIYFDGNSLGAMPRAVPQLLSDVAGRQWAHDLIRSWNKHGWMDVPRRVGDKIARLIGARPGEVVVAEIGRAHV